MFLVFRPSSASSDLLKARTILKEVEVPGYTRADGTYVPPHRKHVHVNPDVPVSTVVSGQGSFTQREAHRRLSRQEWFQRMSEDERFRHILSHATDLQMRRSAAARRSESNARSRGAEASAPARPAAAATTQAPAAAPAAAQAPAPAAARPDAATTPAADAVERQVVTEWQRRVGRLEVPTFRENRDSVADDVFMARSRPRIQRIQEAVRLGDVAWVKREFSSALPRMSEWAIEAPQARNYLIDVHSELVNARAIVERGPRGAALRAEREAAAQAPAPAPAAAAPAPAPAAQAPNLEMTANAPYSDQIHALAEQIKPRVLELMNNVPVPVMDDPRSLAARQVEMIRGSLLRGELDELVQRLGVRQDYRARAYLKRLLDQVRVAREEYREGEGHREGETKVVNGITYILRGGRWHRAEAADQEDRNSFNRVLWATRTTAFPTTNEGAYVQATIDSLRRLAVRGDVEGIRRHETLGSSDAGYKRDLLHAADAAAQNPGAASAPERLDTFRPADAAGIERMLAVQVPPTPASVAGREMLQRIRSMVRNGDLAGLRVLGFGSDDPAHDTPDDLVAYINKLLRAEELPQPSDPVAEAAPSVAEAVRTGEPVWRGLMQAALHTAKDGGVFRDMSDPDREQVQRAFARVSRSGDMTPLLEMGPPPGVDYEHQTQKQRAAGLLIVAAARGGNADALRFQLRSIGAQVPQPRFVPGGPARREVDLIARAARENDVRTLVETGFHTPEGRDYVDRILRKRDQYRQHIVELLNVAAAGAMSGPLARIRAEVSRRSGLDAEDRRGIERLEEAANEGLYLSIAGETQLTEAARAYQNELLTAVQKAGIPRLHPDYRAPGGITVDYLAEGPQGLVWRGEETGPGRHVSTDRDSWERAQDDRVDAALSVPQPGGISELSRLEVDLAVRYAQVGNWEGLRTIILNHNTTVGMRHAQEMLYAAGEIDPDVWGDGGNSSSLHEFTTFDHRPAIRLWVQDRDAYYQPDGPLEDVEGHGWVSTRDSSDVPSPNATRMLDQMAATQAGADAGFNQRPREGELKVVNGRTYRLIDGRWHRVDEPADLAGAMRRMQAIVPPRVDSSEERAALTRLRHAIRSGDMDAIRQAGDAPFMSIRRYSESLLRAAGVTGDVAAAEAEAAAAHVAAPAVEEAVVAESPTPVPEGRSSSMADLQDSVPEAPTITGRNMQNTALIAAQRRVRRMQDNARNGADPVRELLSMSTSAANPYLAAVHRYRLRLLHHFGYGLDGNRISEAAPDLPPEVPVTPRRSSRRAATSAPPENPALDPLYAANPRGQTEAELGFVPRPMIPLTSVVEGRSGWRPQGRGDAVIPWESEALRDLAVRYMSQRTDLQSAARRFQEANVSNSAAMLPEVERGLRGERRSSGDAARDAAAIARVREQRRVEMDNWRDAARAFLDKVSALGDVYQPRRPVGGNVRTWPSGAEMDRVGAYFGMGPDAAKELIGRMISDYGDDIHGDPVKFKVGVRIDANILTVTFGGSDHTYIKRDFHKQRDGTYKVYHNTFSAGANAQAYHTAWMRQIPRPRVSDSRVDAAISDLEGLMNNDESVIGWSPEYAGINPGHSDYQAVKDYHDSLVAALRRPAVAGGKGLFRASLGAYKALGVTQITVFANMDVGGYAWAKYGYEITDSDWDESSYFKQTIRRRLANARSEQRFSPEALDRAEAVMNGRTARESMWALSDMHDGEKSMGKYFLLGTSWHGRIDMDERSVTMRRCLGYIALPTASGARRSTRRRRA